MDIQNPYLTDEEVEEGEELISAMTDDDDDPDKEENEWGETPDKGLTEEDEEE